MSMYLKIASFLLCFAALAGCDLGTLHHDTPAPSPAPTEPPNSLFDKSVDCSDPRLDPGPQYVRRLTNQELVNTVGDVLGVDMSDLVARLPRDTYVQGFKNTATGLTVSGRRAEQYAYIAGEIAERLDAGWMATRADCTLGDTACEQAFLRARSLELFRRPMTDAELARFSRLFRIVEAEDEKFERAARLVVEAMVQSPQFLYRLEAQNPDSRLPKRVFGADQLTADNSLGVELEAGRYRLDVRAALSPGAQPAQMVVSLDGASLEEHRVASEVTSAYVAGFELGSQQAGRHTLAFNGSEDVVVDGVEIVGPFAHSLDFSGPDVADGVRRVTDYEMASRLAYFIWQSAPDEQLIEEASAGRLRTDTQISAQAERMLEDPRARRALRSYLDQWLQLEFLDTIERDPENFPDFSRALVEAMKLETYRLFEAIVWEQKTDLLSVFTAQTTWTTADLARLYGFEPREGADSDESVAYDLSEIDERQGLLTHASILSLTASQEASSPVKRGLYVRTRFLCQPVAPPPGSTESEAPVLEEDATVRERLAQHTEDTQCAYCHRLMDPIGFGFEQYDPVGAYRTHEPNGAEVDASGVLEKQNRRVEGDAFYGAPELGQVLHDGEDVENCMVQNVYQYAIGRAPTRQDICDLRDVRQGFADGGRTYQDLVESVVTSDAFRFVESHKPVESHESEEGQ
jgi:hypothetical protein